MYEVSNQFKAYCKRHIRTFKNATITYYEGNEQQTIESEEIIKFDISAEPYIDYQIIGQAVAKKIHISIKGSYDLANKEVNVTTTMIYDDNTEEVLNLGNYIIASDYDSSVKNQCSFTGYDYMIKMDDEYSDEGLTYPCTIQDVIENICEQKDIELATTDLPNGDLEVIGNNFQDGATYRDVIKQIAQVNGTFAYIDRENKLHIDTLMNHETLQGEGSSVNLQGSTPYGNILDYMLEGNTTQNGTPTPSSPVPVNNVTGEQVVRVCGKNLLDNSILELFNNNKYIKTPNYNTKGSIIVSPNTTYTLSTQNISFTDINVFEFDENNNRTTLVKYVITPRHSFWFTTSATAKTISFYSNNNGLEMPSDLDFQIVVGNQVPTSFEEYQGKDYEINLGKNLFDKDKATTGGRLSSDNGTIYAESGYFYSNFIKVEPSTSYTKNSAIADVYHRVCFYSSASESGYISKSESNTFTTPSNCKYLRFCGIDTEINTTQLEKGTTPTTYAPYFTPIELNKIGNYQDFIRKGTGKNLFSGEVEQGAISSSTNQTYNECKTSNATRIRTIDLYKLDTSKTYTISCLSGFNVVIQAFNNDKKLYIIDGTTNMWTQSVTFTNIPYIAIAIRKTDNSNILPSEVDNTKVQLEQGTTATYYEPYGYKDKWYIEKNVGKVVLDGTENWTTRTASTGAQLYETSVSGFYSTQSITMGYSNQYIANISLINDNTFRIFKGITLALHNDTIGSISNLKTFLSSNNMIVYYPLANTTYTLIENEELIGQLNALNNGYVYGTNSNILVSGNIPSIINISVDAPGRDVEDEITPSSYLTDFKQSREYGPVNRVQITMTDIEDATYIENAESITKDGIQTITINDNYFLSSEELKAKAIRPLWNSLYTMKYMPISCKYLGLPYIEMNDYIGIVLPNGDVTGTYVFNYKFTYNGGYMGELETPTISRTQETYPTESINSQVQKMGINVDRANARITSEIIARQETDENVTRIEQSIDEINLSVSTTQTDLSNLEGQVQTNTASIGVNADNISLAVEKNTQTQDQLDTLQTNTENVVNQLVFNGDGLTISALGSTSDDMKLNLTNDAINFMYNNNVILKINGSTIEFDNASFQKLDLGNYVWVAEDDDSLSLIYEGE